MVSPLHPQPQLFHLRFVHLFFNHLRINLILQHPVLSQQLLTYHLILTQSRSILPTLNPVFLFLIFQPLNPPLQISHLLGQEGLFLSHSAEEVTVLLILLSKQCEILDLERLSVLPGEGKVALGHR